MAVIIDTFQYSHGAKIEKGLLVLDNDLVNSWLSFIPILIASFLVETAFTRIKIVTIVTKIEKAYEMKGLPLTDKEKVDEFYYVYRKATSPSLISFAAGFAIYITLTLLQTIVALSITYMIINS